MNLLTNLNLNKNQIMNGALQKLAVAPSNPVQGQFYFNTGSKTLEIFTGSKWISGGSEGIPDLIVANIKGLQEALDNKLNVLDYQEVSKEAIGLGRVDNTPDLEKPISHETQGELDKKESIINVNTKVAGAESKSKEYADALIAKLIGGSPDILNTIFAIAEALGNDPNFATTIMTELEKKTESFTQTIGDGLNASYQVVHGLGTRDVLVHVRQAGSPYAVVIADVEATTINSVTISSTSPMEIDEYVVTVVG